MLKVTSHNQSVHTHGQFVGYTSGALYYDQGTREIFIVNQTGCRQPFSIEIDVTLPLEQELKECVLLLRELRNNPATQQAFNELVILAKLNS